MNKWEEFLQALRRQDSLTIVGPLFSGSADQISEPVIFVDGGARFRENGIGVSVGDGDSFSGALDYELPTEKNYSDLAFVLTSLPVSIRHIRLLGFLDGRRDHELFNFGEAHRILLNQEKPREISFDDTILCFSAGQWQFEHHSIFSVFCFKETRLRLFGECQYQIPELGEIGTLSSVGLSNVGRGKINLEAEGPIFVFLSNEN